MSNLVLILHLYFSFVFLKLYFNCTFTLYCYLYCCLTLYLYSSIPQGQALSVLTRAHLATGKPQYLEAAVKAVDLFNVSTSSTSPNTSEVGVRGLVLGSYPWYEEYPTQPSRWIIFIPDIKYLVFILVSIKMTS